MIWATNRIAVKEFRLEKRIPTVKEYQVLRKAVGWGNINIKANNCDAADFF